MPLTPDHDRLAVIESQMSHTQSQMSETQAQMTEMMNVMMTKSTQFEQGLNGTTEEVLRQRGVRGSTSGMLSRPASIPEHSMPITENDQDSFALRNGQRASDAMGAAPFTAKRADLGEHTDVVEPQTYIPCAAPAQGPREASAGLQLRRQVRAQDYNFERDESPSRTTVGGGESRPATSVME